MTLHYTPRIYRVMYRSGINGKLVKIFSRRKASEQ